MKSLQRCVEAHLHVLVSFRTIWADGGEKVGEGKVGERRRLLPPLDQELVLLSVGRCLLPSVEPLKRF
ncbi:hypothetical protein EYF80_053063 [Liparis tanakae]|uniref:Uncharacterized protein n=1 Tax=Liparis tanakae TaxID=230148 RepID=A0A4Z2F682_9TELE|nr:hypothetical protein EYF80_053063 [Liparis tanakae]